MPADLVPIFMYSERGERFVNLTPGMEIGIQKVLSNVPLVKPGSRISLPMLTADYDVVSRRGGAIGLRLSHHAGGGHGASIGTEVRLLLTLDKRFAPASVLRLFLQGFSDEKQEGSGSAPFLLGASDTPRLDTLTDLLQQREPVACSIQPAAVCVDLPPGGVSLYSIIWINGRRTAIAFGTSLGSLLLRLPEPNQGDALKSVQLLRKLSANGYASVHITRSVEGTTQLLLLPGDRIEW